MFLVFQIIAFELVVVNYPYYYEKLVVGSQRVSNCNLIILKVISSFES